jgi:hypothetical protein
MRNNQNISTTTTIVNSEINSSSSEQIITFQNSDSQYLPASNNTLENGLIQHINESENLLSLRSQLINNITARLPETNMDLFPDFVTDISDQQREILYNLLIESTIVNNYEPALMLLAIFTNYNGMINLDLILSNMTTTVLESIHVNSETSLVSLATSNETISAPINEIITNNNIVTDIVVRNQSEIDALNRSFITDLIQRSSSAIRSIRINQLLNRFYQFVLTQPQLIIAVLQILRDRTRTIDNSGDTRSRNTNNQTLPLRQILINIYDWLSDVTGQKPKS